MIIRNCELERGRFLHLARSIQPPARSELQILKQKLERQRLVQISSLQRTSVGAMLGKDLGVINRGRANYRQRVLVIRFFHRALRNVGLLAMPSLRGISLTFAEKRLLMRIIMKKRQYLDMVLTEHKKHHQKVLDSLKKTQPQTEISRFREKLLSLDRDCNSRTIRGYSGKNTFGKTADNAKSKADSQDCDESLKYWRNKIRQSREDVYKTFLGK